MIRRLSGMMMLCLLFSCTSERERLIADIGEGEKKLFNDSTRELNQAVANKVLENYIYFADKFREDTLAPEYLFRAGDLANGLHNPRQAIEVHDRLIRDYPQFRKTAAAMFMQGFIYETVIRDKEKAKSRYREFINRYPDHQLASSAQASIAQMEANLTDEELVRMFEERMAK
jgi:TolA-binding protein